MTVIVSVKINDGIVMASDSAATFGTGQIYTNADKIVNMVKGLPVGIMVTGEGGIGSESITTLLKDLRARLAGHDTERSDWKIDAQNFSIGLIAERVREFLFEEKAKKSDTEPWMRLRICGYSSGRALPEIWEVVMRGKECDNPVVVRTEEQFGVNWDGEYEALNRLIFGVGTDAEQIVIKDGATDEQAGELFKKLRGEMYTHLALPAMPIQDAIDLARYLVDTTIHFMKFSVLRQPKTVGGPIEIATVTKHEGFRWIQRKHFYPAHLNVWVS